MDAYKTLLLSDTTDQWHLKGQWQKGMFFREFFFFLKQKTKKKKKKIKKGKKKIKKKKK